eukprot:GHUV01029448.1.p1 GENE.GHUV01029448.1~~GHUV01029448.1.p1  ORF type:complete len:224 (+),score=48.23 GHUV01029448.1:56-673(+)
MQDQQQLRTTFGQLDHVADKVILPSTLNYRERAELQKKHACEYGRTYNSPGRMNVYDRLTADAAVRQNVKSMHTPPSEPVDVDLKLATAAATRGTSRSGSPSLPSGFVSNNNIPATTKSFHEAATLEATTQDPPLSTLHPITLKSYHKKYQMDFLAAARPAAQTTNQTMRMLGTYEGDADVVRMMNVHIPAVGVKPGCFHPDVNC